MALSVVQVASAEHNGGTASTLAVPITTTTGNLLVAWARHGTDITTTITVKDSNGVAWTAVAAGPVHTNSTDITYGEMFYLANGTNTAITSVTATYSVAVGFLGMIVYEISGANITSPEDTSVNTTNDLLNQTSLTSNQFTTTNANDILLFGASTNATSGTYTAGSGYNLPTNSTLTRTAFENQIVSSIQTNATASISWATARTGVISTLGAFKAAAAASPTFEDDSFNVVRVPLVEPEVSIWGLPCQ